MSDREESTLPPTSELSGFRATLLLQFPRERERQVLERFGYLLEEMAYECAHTWPNPPGSYTAHELRAALADLRFLESFLARIGQEREGSQLSVDEWKLAELGDQAREALGEVAQRLSDGLERLST